MFLEQVERARLRSCARKPIWADGDRTPQTVKREHWMRMNPAVKEQYCGWVLTVLDAATPGRRGGIMKDNKRELRFVGDADERVLVPAGC